MKKELNTVSYLYSFAYSCQGRSQKFVLKCVKTSNIKKYKTIRKKNVKSVRYSIVKWFVVPKDCQLVVKKVITVYSHNSLLRYIFSTFISGCFHVKTSLCYNVVWQLLTAWSGDTNQLLNIGEGLTSVVFHRCGKREKKEKKKNEKWTY